MINLNDLSIHYGSKLLFEGVNLLLTKGHRYAIVGANGTGKSTLLRLIAKEETPSLGEILISKGVSIGWVRQDHFRYEEETLVNVVIQGRKALWAAFQEKEALLAALWTDKSANRLAYLEETIAHEEGYAAESLAHVLLEGVGIPPSQHQQPLKTLSGGYKMRVLLAQALFEAPDILLLDEPTNHLDMMSIMWLEEYLIREFKGLLMLVSHDIKFLNQVATHILDIDYGEIREYPGNYQSFLSKKKAVMEQKQQEKKQAEEKIARLQEFVDRFKAKASKAAQAKSKMKMIDKIELPDIKNSSRLTPSLSFNCQRPSGKQVLVVENISKQFETRSVLKDVSFEVTRGEKIAIIGQNGIGKSTLLKIILNLITADKGDIRWGYETKVGYFAQDHHEQLKENISVFEWLSQQASAENAVTIRQTLARVLFKKEEVEKSILNISGGEATRLLLANIMLVQPNVLIMDEPTNHLDVESLAAFAHALHLYKGTLLLVSHDRYFVSRVATRILALTHQGIKDFKGSYQAYLKYYQQDYLSRTFVDNQSK